MGLGVVFPAHGCFPVDSIDLFQTVGSKTGKLGPEMSLYFCLSSPVGCWAAASHLCNLGGSPAIPKSIDQAIQQLEMLVLADKEVPDLTYEYRKDTQVPG